MSRRGQRLLELALLKSSASSSRDERNFTLVKLLELNIIKIVLTSKLKRRFDSDLSTVVHDGKDYHAIVIHSGERTAMEKALQELVAYEKLQKKYHNLAQISQSVQTEELLFPLNQHEDKGDVEKSIVAGGSAIQGNDCISPANSTPATEDPQTTLGVKYFPFPQAQCDLINLSSSTVVSRKNSISGEMSSLQVEVQPRKNNTLSSLQEKSNTQVNPTDNMADDRFEFNHNKGNMVFNSQDPNEQNVQTNDLSGVQPQLLRNDSVLPICLQQTESFTQECFYSNSADQTLLKFTENISSVIPSSRKNITSSFSQSQPQIQCNENNPHSSQQPLLQQFDESRADVSLHQSGYIENRKDRPENSDFDLQNSNKESYKKGKNKIVAAETEFIHKERTASTNHNTNTIEIANFSDSNEKQSELQQCNSAKVTTKDSNFLKTWDKRYHCPICKKSFAKLPRHLETVHSDDLEVKEFMKFPKKSKQRAYLVELLRNKGNFLHNSEVLLKNSGQIVTIRRPVDESEVSDFLPCEFCLGYFSARKLSRHQNQCHHRPDKLKRRNNVKKTAALLLPKSPHASELLCSKVLSAMRNDALSRVIKSDELMQNYGSRLCSKFSELPHLNNFIKQKLRELARFVLAVKEIDRTVKNLTDCFDPSKFDVAIDAVKYISGYNPKYNTFEIPSLAKKIGFSLKKCAFILKAESLKNCDNNARDKITKFMELYDMEWSNAISNSANATLYKKKWNKDIDIPNSPDVEILNSFITKQEIEISQKLQENPNREDWVLLAKISMCHIIIFNRRRVGEVERMTVNDYQNKRSTATDPEIEKLLSKTEINLTQSFSIIEIRGKRGKKVPVLLTPSMKDSLELLIKTRKSAFIDDKNKYIFAVPYQESSYYRGCDVLRKTADLAGCKNPKLITSTLLRKQVATMAQFINLKRNEKEQLASFMGHTNKTHEEFYRLPEKTIQSAKIGKILINMEQSKMENIVGKSLDEVDVDISHMTTNDEKADSHHDLQEPSCSNQRTFSKGDQENEFYTLRNKKINKLVASSESESGESTSDDKKVKFIRRTKRKPTEKMPWSPEELSTVKKHFSSFILLQKVPNKSECIEFLNCEPQLKTRSWKNIKFCVYNSILRTKKKRLA